MAGQIPAGDDPIDEAVFDSLLRFEVNVRGATVLGIVGAGGIGEDLIVAIRKFFYSDVSAILLMIVATVMLIDMLSARVRHRLLATETQR